MADSLILQFGFIKPVDSLVSFLHGLSTPIFILYKS